MSNSARVCLCMAVLFTAILLFAVSPALAQVTFSDNEAQFLARNPNLQFQDFESGNVATDALAECSPVLNENTSDTCFSPGDILPGIQFAEVPVNELNIAGPDVEDNPFAHEARAPELHLDVGGLRPVCSTYQCMPAFQGLAAIGPPR